MSDLNYSEFAEKLNYLRKSPSAFVEEVCGIKLNMWQKVIVEMSKYKSTSRMPMRKWNAYINLCITYKNMEDDDFIIIASPKKWVKLGKAELLKYIENYWK